MLEVLSFHTQSFVFKAWVFFTVTYRQKVWPAVLHSGNPKFRQIGTGIIRSWCQRSNWRHQIAVKCLLIKLLCLIGRATDDLGHGELLQWCCSGEEASPWSLNNYNSKSAVLLHFFTSFYSARAGQLAPEKLQSCPAVGILVLNNDCTVNDRFLMLYITVVKVSLLNEFLCQAVEDRTPHFR
jgi:hypothetical protein